MEEGLTNEQTEKILQFQDLTGIDDLNVCRDILIRHQWDLEVAYQEQQNIRDGRPTMFATSTNLRAPAVINDRFLQQIFTSTMPGGRSMSGSFGDGSMPRNLTGFIKYIFSMVFQYCYSTLSSIVLTFLNLGRSDEMIVTDPLGDVVRTINSYSEKYSRHPVFYQGTYAQALNDAKQELRFLLVYLHKDPEKNPDIDSFCSQTLSDPSVIEFINRNALFWACDVSYPEGYRVSQTLNARNFPIMLLIGLRDHRMTIMGRFEGDCTSEELVRRLQTVIDNNGIWLSQARADRLERNFTKTLREQQDEAYRLSLLADEEKERVREMEREAERKIKEALEREIFEAKERKENIARLKIDLAILVPEEPPVNVPDTISVVFKLPSGARIERRFLQTNMLSDVYNYIFCHPLSPDSFQITTNFPKRVLCCSSFVNLSGDEPQDGHPNNKTLAEVGLKNREVLFVNDLEA